MCRSPTNAPQRKATLLHGLVQFETLGSLLSALPHQANSTLIGSKPRPIQPESRRSDSHRRASNAMDQVLTS